MSDLDFDPLNDSTETPIKPPSGAPVRLELSESIARKQVPILRVIARMHDLFWDLPNITTREVDNRLQELFNLTMDAAAEQGISRMSVPKLQECCGKKRTWPDEAPTPEEKLGWGLGDIFRRITRLFGFKHCEACERRRKALNNLFRFTRK